MKSLTLLLQAVLDESGTRCHTSTSRDVKTITARFEHEGESFLTITLPNFGKDFEKSLDQGFVDHTQFPGFSWAGGLPRFLGGFLDLVFDRSTGRLLDIPSIDAIRCIRQITLMFGKVELECTKARVDSAIKKYVECEQDVRRSDQSLSDDSKESFSRISGLLWNTIFTIMDSKIFYDGVVPRHGPGATADKLKGNRKFEQSEWTQRLEEYFPHGEYLASSWSLFLSELGHVKILEPGAERPVRIVTVPKTLKTPRIIAIEPTCMMYVQEGISDLYKETIEANNSANDFIGYSSQIPNQELAKEGSLTGRLATLDLSEASDRVSYQHVRLLLKNFPHFAGAVDAARSRKADVPDHGVIRLAKFASMGSALCFPFEATVFLTVIFVGIEKALNRRLTKRDISSLRGSVRVYGDDIIVPVEYVGSVVGALEAFGLKVNSSKSFWTGKFRESCGKDYYAGVDVSIVRMRQLFPTQRKQVPELISTVSLRNQLYKAGYYETVKMLDERIERLIPFPRVSPTSSALGRHDLEGFETQKMCPQLQKPMVKAYVVDSIIPNSRLDGYGALMKFFLKPGDMPFPDKKHLVRAGRPVAVGIKHRWTYSY